MAKKQSKQDVKVKCVDCKYSSCEPSNFLIGCVNTDANPAGAKKGTWGHFCSYFEKK